MKIMISLALAALLVVACVSSNRGPANDSNSQYARTFDSWENVSFITVVNKEGHILSDKIYANMSNNQYYVSKKNGYILEAYNRLRPLMDFKESRCFDTLMQAEKALKESFEDIGTIYFQRKFVFVYDKDSDPKVRLRSISVFPQSPYANVLNANEDTNFYRAAVVTNFSNSTMSFSDDKPCEPGEMRAFLENIRKSTKELWEKGNIQTMDKNHLKKQIEAFENDISQ